jgi:hypothetical protein
MPCAGGSSPVWIVACEAIDRRCDAGADAIGAKGVDRDEQQIGRRRLRSRRLRAARHHHG